MCAEDNLKLIKEACKGMSSEEGGMNPAKFWKLKKKLRGIITEPPTAMLDNYGNLVTSSSAVEELTVKMYEDRLKALQIRDELKLHKLQRESLCDDRLIQAQANKTPDWNLGDLEVVLKQLKKQ